MGTARALVCESVRCAVGKKVSEYVKCVSLMTCEIGHYPKITGRVAGVDLESIKVVLLDVDHGGMCMGGWMWRWWV